MAAATASPTSGAVPLLVSFDGRGSSDPDGTISTFAWNFGDGTTGTGPTMNHTYTTTGVFVATLTVTDNSGATAWATREILVNPAPPTVVNAPSNLSGSVSGTTIVLTWNDNSNNEDGFYVERAIKGPNVFARVGQTGAGVATFSESLSPATYLYRVRAFRGTTLSAPSSKIQLRVQASKSRST
jgi:PKD repeat protein